MNLFEIVNGLVETAREQAPEGAVFVVRDLMPGIQWRQFSRADAMRIGVLFYAAVEGDADFEILEEKSAQRQQRYRRL